jgi:hypothetical protein
MTNKILALVFFIALPPSGVSIVPADIPQRVGDCRTPQGASLDLGKVLFLETKSVIIEGVSETYRVVIEGERVKIYDLKPKREGFYVTNIAYEVAPREDLDIKIKLAYISGELVLYWKETFEHQIYRQGLFHFVNARPVALCEGRGGSTSYE